MDLNDQAAELEERQRQEAISRARSSAPILIPTGRCVWCGETLDPASPNKRFCDKDHRDEYDRFVSRHPELANK